MCDNTIWLQVFTGGKCENGMQCRRKVVRLQEEAKGKAILLPYLYEELFQTPSILLLLLHGSSPISSCCPSSQASHPLVLSLARSLSVGQIHSFAIHYVCRLSISSHFPRAPHFSLSLTLTLIDTLRHSLLVLQYVLFSQSLTQLPCHEMPVSRC